MSQLQERYQEARDAAEVERNLSLVISRLEDFSAKVTNGLDGLDRSGMRDVIRILVRRIEIDDGHIEVVFRIPSPEGLQIITDRRKWLLATSYRRWSSARSRGLDDAGAWPRIGKISTAEASHSYVSRRSGAC